MRRRSLENENNLIEQVSLSQRTLSLLMYYYYSHLNSAENLKVAVAVIRSTNFILDTRMVVDPNKPLVFFFAPGKR